MRQSAVVNVLAEVHIWSMAEHPLIIKLASSLEFRRGGRSSFNIALAIPAPVDRCSLV